MTHPDNAFLPLQCYICPNEKARKHTVCGLLLLFGCCLVNWLGLEPKCKVQACIDL